jgi:hypothetical protein
MPCIYRLDVDRSLRTREALETRWRGQPATCLVASAAVARADEDSCGHGTVGPNYPGIFRKECAQRLGTSCDPDRRWEDEGQKHQVEPHQQPHQQPHPTMARGWGESAKTIGMNTGMKESSRDSSCLQWSLALRKMRPQFTVAPENNDKTMGVAFRAPCPSACVACKLTSIRKTNM